MSSEKKLRRWDVADRKANQSPPSRKLGERIRYLPFRDVRRAS